MKEGFSATLWAPGLAFICASLLAMALVLLVHNGWFRLCMNWFALVHARSDLNELRVVSRVHELYFCETTCSGTCILIL